jgi:hypothetical protein
MGDLVSTLQPIPQACQQHLPSTQHNPQYIQSLAPLSANFELDDTGQPFQHGHPAHFHLPRHPHSSRPQPSLSIPTTPIQGASSVQPPTTQNLSNDSNTASCVPVNSQPTAVAPRPVSATCTHPLQTVRTVTPTLTSGSSLSTHAPLGPPTPARLVSTPGTVKPKWYAVVVGQRTGVFDDW